MDYAGISFLISGSTFPPYVYNFYCQPHLYFIYLGILSFVATVVFIVSLCSFIHAEKYRNLKAVMYGALGIFAAFPIIHLLCIE